MQHLDDAPEGRQPSPTPAAHWPAGESGDHRRVAIVLNARARAVTSTLVETVKGALRDETVYLSHSDEQAQFIAHHIVNCGYEVVLCGGGDGTFCRIVSDVMALRPLRTPAFGVLRLGTGNAMADTLGVGHEDASQLMPSIRRTLAQSERFAMPLLKTSGRLTPFVGLGLDALVLQDYKAVQEALERTPLPGLGTGAVGYGLAVATRSLWRYLGRPLPVVVIRNEGAPVRRLDRQGRTFGRPIARGQIIYRGPVTIAAASTIPFYGMGLRLFPQANQQAGCFQLRVARVGAVDMLAHLRSLFEGTYASEELWDFACTEISVHATRPTPVQVAGDLLGSRSELAIGMHHVQALGDSSRSGLPFIRAPERTAAQPVQLAS